MEPIDVAVWNDSQRDLWRRLCTHRFEQPELALDFTHKLAREQGWSLEYARCAVNEYRRYCFIACVAGIEATPSVDVDAVWHLHLIHSQDYWQVWCPQVLGMPLHHSPSRGGRTQALYYREQYAQTLAHYERWFGPPPEELWPGTHERFAAQPRRIAVDRERHWIVPKPSWPSAAVASAGALALLATLMATDAFALASNPLDWQGGDFLRLFAVLMLVSVIGAVILRRAARNTGPARGERPSAFDLAYLAGGAPRCADAAIAQLLADEVVVWDPLAKELKLRGSPTHAKVPLDAVARCVAPDGDPVNVVKRAAVALQPVQQSLVARGFMLDDAAAWRVRLYSALPLLLVCLFGGIKIMVGLDRGKPVGFLVVLTIILGVIALVLLLKRPSRTRAGDDAVAAAKRQHARALRAPRSQEMGLAVALLGTAALSGTAYAAYHNARTPPSSTSSDGSSTSSDSSGGDSGGGDGGGGGCGGCGGGGD